MLLAQRKQTGFSKRHRRIRRQESSTKARGRQFHKEGPMTVKDLDRAIVVLARGTKSIQEYPDYPRSEENKRMWRKEGIECGLGAI